MIVYRGKLLVLSSSCPDAAKTRRSTARAAWVAGLPAGPGEVLRW
jgi:hypothetical protein